MSRTEEIVVAAIVVACTAGRLFHQARGATRLRWTKPPGSSSR